MSITGTNEPSKLGFAITDVLTGLNLTNGIMSGLYYREKTGKGIHVKTSL